VLNRIENPNNYNEHHVQDASSKCKLYLIPQVNAVVHAPSTYGSVNIVVYTFNAVKSSQILTHKFMCYYSTYVYTISMSHKCYINMPMWYNNMPIIICMLY
jgi:hypothetical protein